MANGTDSEDKFVVLSKIRVGLKREFEFALKVQSEISGSLGRTRARKVENNVDSGYGSEKKLKTYESRKKRKKLDQSSVVVINLDKETGSVSEEEAKSDVVDVVVDEVKVDLNNERERNVVDGELMCIDEVEKEKEGKNDAEKAEILVNVEEGKGENDQMEGERNEFNKEPLSMEVEDKNELDKISMNVGGDKCEDANKENHENDQMWEETKEVENAEVSLREEKNECDKVLRDVEGDKYKELDNEKENDVKRAVMGAGEKIKSELERKVVDKGVVEEVLLKVTDSGNLSEEGLTLDEPVVIGGNDDQKVVERPLKMKDSGNFCEGGLTVDEPVVICSNDDRKVVNIIVERPLRRFTRSLLQKQAELGNMSSKKDGGKESHLNKVANGDDDGFGTPLIMRQENTMRSKKVMRKFYTKLKNFLDTGILEGVCVKYIRSSKVQGPEVRGLRGVIKGSGILCFCGDCKGDIVVTPAVFELHAGSSNKRPPEYIYLENGNTLRDVMNACKDSPLETLEEAVRTIVGSSFMKESSFCLNCRGSNTRAGLGEVVLLCNSCIELKESQAATAPLTDANSCVELESQAGSVGLPDTSDRSPEPDSAQKSSHSKMKSSSSKSQGKITRKDLRMHKLVFEEGGLEDGTEVAYFVRGQKLLVGYKKGFGILCSCCHSEVSPSQFEAHAGWASRRKPFQHIYTSNGVSLHEYSIKLSREKKFSTKENDDLCGICMDGGDLLCCDSCPRAFHIDCVSLPGIPSGSWYCRYCQNTFQKERFVEHNANARAAGRVLGVDPTNRCIRIVQTPDTELGGCVLCRGRDFCKSGFGRRTVILCDQCEREYHVGCLKDHEMEDLKELPKGKWLCSSDCKRINSALEKLVDRGEEKIPEASLDVIKKKHQENGSDNAVDFDVRWRVLRGKKVDSSDGTRALLSKAVSIFHDRFDPIIESASKLDLIPSMVYGRNLKGQDYHGMYCAILTVNQEVVSAGIFRIFGQELAELPLVATSTECQGQGYFQCLFSCIEKLLGFLNIKTLVLPSASEAQAIWTNKFTFNMMIQEEQNKYRNDYPLMIFQGTSMLQKPVPKCRIVGKSVEGDSST